MAKCKDQVYTYNCSCGGTLMYNSKHIEYGSLEFCADYCYLYPSIYRAVCSGCPEESFPQDECNCIHCGGMGDW
ncbi:MAG: hypothetical protein ACE15E_20730 [Acidobacteriota bacterium]